MGYSVFYSSPHLFQSSVLLAPFSCLLHSCAATSVSATTHPVNHVSLGALFSRHDHTNQLLEEAMLVFVSFADSSNEKQVYCMTIWGINSSASESGTCLPSLHFYCSMVLAFLLLLPKFPCPGGASLNLSHVPATLISCSL